MSKKVSRKIYAFARVTKYINLPKSNNLMNAFFSLQCSYFLIIWICRNCINNTKITRLHERCLQIIYKNKNSSFIQKGCFVSIHDGNMQILTAELRKLMKGISSNHISKIFKTRNQ